MNSIVRISIILCLIFLGANFSYSQTLRGNCEIVLTNGEVVTARKVSMTSTGVVTGRRAKYPLSRIYCVQRPARTGDTIRYAPVVSFFQTSWAKMIINNGPFEVYKYEVTSVNYAATPGMGPTMSNQVLYRYRYGKEPLQKLKPKYLLNQLHDDPKAFALAEEAFRNDKSATVLRVLCVTLMAASIAIIVSNPKGLTNTPTGGLAALTTIGGLALAAIAQFGPDKKVEPQLLEAIKTYSK